MLLKNWKGNLASGIKTSTRENAAVIVRYFIITNKSNADITLNVYVNNTDGADYLISPLNLLLEVGESYTDKDVVLLEREAIKIDATGSVDYYFSITDS
jgi:hypothetical protein